MQSKSFGLILLTLSLSGCNDFFNTHRTPDWALVNKHKVQSAVQERIKQSNPYPEELGEAYEDAKAEYELANQQISNLKRSGMQHCMNLQSDGKQQKRPSNGIPPIPAHAYGNALIGLGSSGNPEIQTCIQNLESDQLILDLKAKSQSFSKLQQQRREHDQKVYKITESTVDLAIAKYAESKGFELIINNESSIAYNQNQQVLDVTGGVIDLINNPPPAQ